ncbi:MAG TPA: MBL fold metallo-hydrolase [Gemmatimonadaceae bacterium]|nr:MBL fold metallo-hydrolase [Gemmatimonadaceae bacterium]
MSAPTPLHRCYRFGRWTVHELQAGGQQLDGGAMFGVVPKVLWQRRITPDDRNRIPLGMRCLLVEHEIGLVLVDSGAGNKEDPKFHDIYGVENAGADGRTMLEDAIRAAGFTPDDVALVVNTHLHFDHAGGNTYRDASGAVRPSFPNARYVVQAGEYAYATTPNERTAASYFPHNFVPVHEAGRLDLVEGEVELAPGLRVLPTPGHTPHHQSVLLDAGGGEVLCFLGDLVPTQWHVPLPWIMGYDVEPLVTLESKRRLLGRALTEGWRVVFEHDAHVAGGRLGRDGKGIVLAEPDAA